MPSRIPPTLAFCLLSLFIFPVFSRHAHRRPMHRHAARADLPATTTTLAVPSPITAGNAVAEDLQKIQEGFNDLPEDLLNFILALEKRLQEVEALLGAGGSAGPVETLASILPMPVDTLATILPLSVTPSPVVETLASILPPPVTSDYVETLASILPLPVTTSYEAQEPTPTESAATTTSASTSSIRLCKTGGAGPLVPCDEPYRTTYTSHLTRTSTLTRHMPIPTGALSNASHPLPNGTAFTPPSPWTAPYRYTRSSSTHKAVTYTVNYAPESPLPTQPESTTTSAPTISNSSPPSSTYTFDPNSEDNVAIYYGTSPATTTSGLLSLCQNPNVDIILLSFVYDFFSASNYPSMSLGPGCAAANPAQQESAPGLKDCSALAPSITICQETYGKKILLSLGGYVANTTFTSFSQATTFASTLWSLFGPVPTIPESVTALRPFGPAILDGFDIDNESHSTTHYPTFATSLRTLYSTSPLKKFYLSAAPQCPIPDASIPPGALALADFVWVQFYNNPSCNLDGPGFQDSFAAWAALLSRPFTSPSTPTSPYPDESLPRPGGPKVFIGTGAWAGAGSGYVIGSGLATRVSLAREQGVGNFGGMMLWDGLEGLGNVDGYGVSYLKYAKEALH